MTDTRRVAHRDWVWRDVQIAQVLGPFDGVDLIAVRTAVLAIGAADPESVLFRVLDRSQRSVRVVAPTDHEQHATRIVVEDPLLGTADAGATAERYLRLGNDDRLVRLFTGNGYLALLSTHLAGDGRATLALFRDIVHAAVTAAPIAVPAYTESPLPLALRRTFPTPRSYARTGATFVARTVRAVRAAGPPRGGAQLPWRPSPAVESVTSGPDLLPALRAWRKEHASGVSLATILISLAETALRDTGVVTPGAPPVVLYDLRRYLPRRLDVRGNFSVGTRLPSAGLAPAELQRVVTAELDGGFPLISAVAQLGLARIAAVASRRPHTRIGTTRDAVLTHTGRHLDYHRLPWTPGADRVSVEAPSAAAAGSITLALSEMFDRLYVTASFHDTSFDRERVRAALHLLTSGALLVGAPAMGEAAAAL